MPKRKKNDFIKFLLLSLFKGRGHTFFGKESSIIPFFGRESPIIPLFDKEGQGELLAITSGRTLEELEENMKDAYMLMAMEDVPAEHETV